MMVLSKFTFNKKKYIKWNHGNNRDGTELLETTNEEKIKLKRKKNRERTYK